MKGTRQCISLTLCIGMTVGCSISIFAQTSRKTSIFPSSVVPTEIKSLSIGDKVPDIQITNLFNYSKNSINLLDLKGKVVILDFWEIFCAPCLGALPKIQRLQEKFKDKLQVITITKYSTKEKILDQVQRSLGVKEFSLPTATHDNKMFKYFPFRLLSHVVWIDKDGTVIAFTGTEHVTEENVKKVIEGDPIDWPIKIDVADFDYEKPLVTFSENEVNSPNFLFYSALTGPLEGIAATSAQKSDSIKQTITYNTFNNPLLDLCKGAVDGRLTGNYDLKDVIFNVKDPDRYNVKSNTKGYYWTSKGNTMNTFCYSITMPLKTSSDERKRIISEDLAKWIYVTLGITVKKEKRLVDVLILTKKQQLGANYIPMAAKGSEIQTISIKERSKQFVNVPFIQFRSYLNNNVDSIPFVVDETGISPESLVDFELPIKTFNDIPALKKALEKYGLDIQEGKREREMYIITEKEYVKN